MKKSSSSRSLKRRASLNGSDASGTDASIRRKKHKSKHLSSTQPTPGHSRPGSPANVPPSSSAPHTLDPSSARVHRRGGAGSDTETDGAAMSDASRAQRRQQRLNIARGSGSTPGSGPGTASPAAQPSSRAGSPAPVLGAPRVIPFPSAQDIKNAIPPDGISVKDLVRIVPHPADKKKEFVTLVKEITRLDKERGLLLPKETAPQ